MTEAVEPVTRGLSSSAAADRLRTDGPNALPQPRRPSASRRLVAQLIHFFALMLWTAGALAFVAGLPALGVAIFLVVVLNAVFAFAQESRAGKAAERLRAMLSMSVTVWRDGRRQRVDGMEVVAGDLVALEPGDRIAADGVVRESHGLVIDTSTLTGESRPVRVEEAQPVHAGTFVVEGEASVDVTATGGRTRLASIAALTTDVDTPASPLTLALGRVVRTVSVVAVGVGAAFFLLVLLLGRPGEDGFVLAIGVTVALVPEALLPTVTLSLAWGAEQMAHRRVLVRNLDAVETLGSTTFICTDKTGTLTHNQMTVVEVWTPTATARITEAGYDPTVPVHLDGDADAIRSIARTAARCSNGYVHREDGVWRAHGDPMEAAIDALARRTGVDTDSDRAADHIGKRFPFDPRRRRMSVLVADELLVKGAPDAVLPVCASMADATAVLDRMTSGGLRVLAVATRHVEAIPASADEAERDLRLIGLLGMEDPPRQEVRSALVACRRAGVSVAMVTGDHPATAAAIADEVGLRKPDVPVLTGDDLPDDLTALGELLDVDGCVVARASPEDKLRIAQALRHRGHVVAMTGDGVNDGPSLHEADIGIAMGMSGTDVAREASDLVLLDDRFDTIVAGIEQGRATFLNMRRFLTYHLTDNVAELTPLVVWGISGGRFPLALGVLQILALDIGTDTLSAVALGAEPPSKGVLDRPPLRGHLLNRTVARRAFGMLGPIIALGAMVAFLASCVAAGWTPGAPFPVGQPLAAASGAAFVTVVIAQTANAFACRSSTRTPWALGWTTNRLLWPAIAVELVVSTVVLVVPAIADELEHAVPPPAGWLIAVMTAGAILAVDASDKRRRTLRAADARGPSVLPQAREKGCSGGRGIVHRRPGGRT